MERTVLGIGIVALFLIGVGLTVVALISTPPLLGAGVLAVVCYGASIVLAILRLDSL